ncbi:MAG TPA: ArsR family transcriptional regulator [Nitrososphaeraceae archaeon]|nr:ArsR family transcriptional regulator [Nitrososphaeraceae archaeon]
MPKAKYNNKFNSVQKKIIRFINETPGIRYRELLRITGVSNGSLSYNLNLLNNSGVVRVNKVNDRVTRFFSRDVSTLEYNVIGLLRQNTTRKIIVYMLKYGPCYFNDIVNYTHKAPSTISWHLSRLKDSKIIQGQQKNKHNYYDIKIDKFRLEKIINKYKSSLQKNH